MSETESHAMEPVAYRASDIPPQLSRYVPEVQRFIDRHRQVFNTIAMDFSLTYTPSAGFHFNFETGEVGIGVEDWQWAEEKGLNEWGRVWSVGHEIEHFQDMKKNPRAVVEHFAYMRRRAKELAPQAAEILSRKTGGRLPDYLTRQEPIGKGQETMSGLEKFLYQRLSGELYNAMDDMYVNQHMALRCTVFAPGGSEYPEVVRLYRDFLYPTHTDRQGEPPDGAEPVDYTGRPLSFQMMDSLLRKTMVPDQDILVLPEVSGLLQGYADAMAEKMGITLAKEAAWLVSPANRKAADPGWRYEQIRRSIEPVFVRLLLQDLEQFDIPPEPPPQDTPGNSSPDGQDTESSAGQPGSHHKPDRDGGQTAPSAAQKAGNTQGQKSQSGNPWGSQDDKPEPVNEEMVAAFIAQQQAKAEAEKAKQKAEKKLAELTPADRAKLAEHQLDAALCKKLNIDPALATEYRDMEAAVEQYKSDLAEVFEQMMNTLSLQISRYWSEGFRSGRFNIDAFIAKYGPMLAAEQPDFVPWEMLDAYDQREFMSRLDLFPDHIRVRLVLDGSGSMIEERLKALKQLSVLFLESLSTFELTMNLRYRLNTPFVVDTEIQMFGSEGKNKIIKPFTGSADPETEKALRFTAMGEINNDYGMTCDAEALWNIATRLDPDDRSKIREGKAKEFVFVITDGGSNEVSNFARSALSPVPAPEDAGEDSRNALAVLTEAGLLARGFQIGTPSEEEKDTFNAIWGENGKYTPDPKDLVPAVAEAFAGEIRKTRIFILAREEDDDTIQHRRHMRK